MTERDRTLPLAHTEPPHTPGTVTGCTGCEAECHCTEIRRLLGEPECVFCASLPSHRDRTAPMPRVPVHPDPETDNRTIPACAAIFPVMIAERGMVAAALVPSRRGEHPFLAVMILREDDCPPMRAFAVVHASSPDGVEWTAYNGTYDCSYTNAMEIFREDLNSRT